MAKPKPLKPFSIKIDEPTRIFIKLTAKAQGHYNMSEVVKRLLDREMSATK
jgi:hypothetical protein